MGRETSSYMFLVRRSRSGFVWTGVSPVALCFLDAGFVDQKDGNVIAHRIDTLARITSERIVVGTEAQWIAARGAC